MLSRALGAVTGTLLAVLSCGDPPERRVYVNETLEVTLPPGQTLANFNAVSIWCSRFRENFGSGVFAAPTTGTAVMSAVN